LRTLLVDNHDSYTFNLYQLIAEVAEPVVVVNDDPVLKQLPSGFDNIVISPGPGRPPGDIGYVGDLLRNTDLPVLGVCLGHQAIAWQAGATVGPAPEPRHGYLSQVKHDGDELFDGIPTEFTAVRYHSLCVEEPLPDTLIATARAEDGVIMALRHRDLPRWGVQFHPESFASQYGRELIRNFTALTERRSPLRLIIRTVPARVDTETMFAALFDSSPTCFWLDSAGLSRFSFLGDGSGPLSETLTHRVGGGDGFELLDRRLRERRLPDPGLPFDFTGGYVGYFGYEMKADCGADAAHVAATPDAVWIFADRLIAVDHQNDVAYLLALHDGSEPLHAAARDWIDGTAEQLAELAPAEVPRDDGAPPADLAPFLVRDEAGYRADIEECKRELIAGESYEICLTNRLHLPFASGDSSTDLAFYRRLRQANPAPYAALLRAAGVTVFSSSPERFLRIERDGRVDSKPIKGTAARHIDPALDVRAAAELAASPKNRAENLMIVDLMRNDLGRVCRVGSVTVERYLAVESYATVHHLVSTIQGYLSPAVSAVECVRSCFPAGSMTGAPKLRTMQIIDRLERDARGVYSGALGYFGLSGGADLSVVIRTAVRQGNTLTVGAGGAIVLDSDAAEEFAEMLVKAAAPLAAYR